MGSLRKSKPFYIRSMDTNGTGLPLNLDNWTDIDLDRLPARMEKADSIGVLTRIELIITAYCTTRASDPALPSYIDHMLVDAQLLGPDGVVVSDRRGYQDPVREYLQFGRFVGQQAADIPATGGGGPGAYTRTFTKQIAFVEPRMADPLARCLPVTYFRAGKLRLFCHGAQQVVLGVGLGSTRFTITAIFWIQDIPANRVPIGAFIREGYKAGDNAQRPTPESGRFLRATVVNPPTLATYTDDLSSITRIDFGAEDGAGFLHRDRDTSELWRRWNDDNSQDPRIMSTGVTYQEINRYLDPLQVASAKAHALPLVYPHKGDSLLLAPAWSAKPELKINNDVKAGTPPTVDWIYDVWMPRSEQQLTQILESIKSGLSRRYTPHVAPLYSKMPLAMAPLIVDATK